MKKLLAPVAAAAGFLLTASLVGWLLATYLPGMTVGTLFAEADIAVKLAMMMIVMAYFPITGLATADLLTGRGAFRAPLIILGICAIVLGGLGALYRVMIIQQALAVVGPMPLAVTAAGYAEAALSMAIGLIGATVAFTGRVLGDRRAAGMSIREA